MLAAGSCWSAVKTRSFVRTKQLCDLWKTQTDRQTETRSNVDVQRVATVFTAVGNKERKVLLWRFPVSARPSGKGTLGKEGKALGKRRIWIIFQNAVGTAQFITVCTTATNRPSPEPDQSCLRSAVLLPILTIYFHLSLGLQIFAPRSCMHSSISRQWHCLCSSHHPAHDLPISNTNYELLITQFSPSSCHLLSLSLYQMSSRTPSAYVALLIWRTKFQTHNKKTARKGLSFIFLGSKGW